MRSGLWWAGPLALLVGSACSSAPAYRSEPCEDKSPSNISVAPRELVGRYHVQFVGTAGEAAAKEASGELRLELRPQEFWGVPDLGGVELIPGWTEPLIGAATIDLAKVGAFTEGRIDTLDPAAPGVAVRFREGPEGLLLSLELGSEHNRRRTMMLDGRYTHVEITAASHAGIFGRWEASVGPSTYHAAGHLCARPLE